MKSYVSPTGEVFYGEEADKLLKRRNDSEYLIQNGVVKVGKDRWETAQFFRYEGKLATAPIVAFIDRYSNRCHGKLVDIGCGSKPYIKYFNYIDEYIGVDLISNEADIVANAKSLPIESKSVDIVLCNQVIEHDAEPVKIIAEIRRILKKDGVLILSAPQMGRLHGEPNDYYRFTKWGLNYLLEKNDMKIEVIEPHGGIFRAIGSHLNFFIIEYFGKDKRRKYILRRTILGLNNFIFSFLDKLITWEKDTLGYNIIAKKKEVINNMAERAHPEDLGFQEGSPYRANLFKRYAFANKFTKGKTVLDIPCGVGWGTSLLRGKYRIGIDISADAIAYANEHYPGIDFSVGDMANISLKDDSVDVVVCLEGFEHVSKATGKKFLAEAARLIKEDGLLVMTVPIILPGGKHSGNPYHIHEPALSDLKNILAQRFYTQSMEIVKGPDGPMVYFVGCPKHKTNIYKSPLEQTNVKYSTKNTCNILLTTSAAPAQSPFSTKEKRPPVGIGFLISVLRNAGHEVFFIDNYLQPNNFLETDFLQKHQIDYVGIYANTICFRDTLRIIYKLKDLRQAHKWSGKIIVGGPHTTVAVDTIPDFVDYVVQGEGERAILDIVSGKVGQRVVNYPRIENLDMLPMPAWDYFVDLPYDWSVRFFEDKPVFTMNTSRGCPFNCTFCSVGSVWGKKHTYFSAERIVSDIEYLIRRYGLKGVYFREDNFTLNKERLRRFCNLLIEKGIKISWVCESRVSNLSRDLVELVSRAGAKGFYFGVESGSQRILDFLHKDITVEQIKDAFKWCHESNINTAASVIVGVPGETESDRHETDKLLNEINPTVTWFNVFVGIPDSNLYRFALNKRLYEYIDDRGLVYLQGHNSKVQHYYGGSFNAYIPDNEKNKDMTIKPKISVLISVYNGEKFIEQSLKSIYNQTYQDFEVIIVDDGSTDNTSDIIVNLKDSRTFIYRNSENKGLTKSLNIGLKLCRGGYIARMDADDISHPQRFEKQVRFLDENPNCIALGSWYGRINSNGEIWASKETPTNYEDIKKQLLAGNCVGHGTAMLRRSSLVEIGGYNEKYTFAQDYDLWLRLSEVGEIQNLGEYLYYLRSWPGTISAVRGKQQNEHAELALQEALQRKHNTEPDSIGVCYTLGSLYLSNGKFDEAQVIFERMLQQLAKMLASGRLQSSGSELENYSDLAQCYLSSCTKLAQCYTKQGKYDKVKQIYTHLLDNQYLDLPEKQKADINSVLAKLENIKLPAVSTEHSQPNFRDAQAEPLVSVIMPAYNAADYIAKAIESVLTQSYKKFELIVVDDGSTDQTKDLVPGFKDERIRYFYQENSGLASSHNRGIKESKGAFTIKLDSDDMMTPDFIARHIEEFEKHPEADLVYCDDYLIDENDKPIRVIERSEYPDQKSLIRDLFRSGFPVVPFRTCIRRSVFDKIGFFDEDLLIGEDYDMMRRFVKSDLKIHHLKGALYLRRMTSDSLSRNYSTQNAKCLFDVLKRFADTFAYDELFPNVAWDKIPAEMRQLHAKCLATVTYLAIGQDYVKSNSPPIYAKMAFGQACSELNDCLKIDPNNQQIQQLLQKCEFGKQKYDEQIQQAVC